MSQRRGPAALALSLLLLAACADTGSAGGDSPPEGDTRPEQVQPAVDPHSLPFHQTISAAGGSVEGPEGVQLSIPPGAAGPAAGWSVGLGPGTAPTGADAWGQVLTPWLVLATDQSVSTAVEGVQLSFPLSAPAGYTADHPGLRMLAWVPGVGVACVDGRLDSGSGRFVVEAVGLPESATLAVVWNPALQRITTDDIPVPPQRRAGLGWPTIDWTIDFDGQKISLEQARRAAGFAKQAALTYSNAGLKPPFLYKDTLLGKTRWHIHLVNDGSSFDGSNDPNNADPAARFGRLNLSTDRIDSPKSFDLGSGLASVAHEMFHAVFASYAIPYQTYIYTENGTRYGYPSDSGFNEGMATAAGYFIDQGAVKPRPSEDPLPLSLPAGIFSSGDQGLAYRSQDFFVFLARAGGLGAFDPFMTALQGTVFDANRTNFETLADYHARLAAQGVGVGTSYVDLYMKYVVERAFVRTEEGHIWPDEPKGGTAGQRYVMDTSLFAGSHVKIKAADCTLQDTGSRCRLTVADRRPWAAVLIEADFRNPDGPPMASGEIQGSFRAKSALGKVSVAALAEKDGVGTGESWMVAAEGEDAKLEKLVSEWDRAWLILLPRTTGSGAVDVELDFGTPSLAGACKALGEWWCKCSPATHPQPCWAYEYSINTVCANISPGDPMGCEDWCAETVMPYIEASESEDPTLWTDALGCTNPR